MAIRSNRNLYPGINAHLNSFLQSEGGGWESFHAHHIVDIATILDKHLPPNYYAAAEKSLQISQVSFAETITRQNRPDVAIYQLSEQQTYQASSSVAAAPIATLPLIETLEDEEETITSVVIYEIEDGKIPGKAVTRIELLSPANKPGQGYYRQYMSKRTQALRSGLFMAEIDYLHESRPIIPTLPSYANGDEDAYPYLILVSNPHPKPEDGHIDIYGTKVDELLPIINIPLADAETVPLDLGAAYNQTFENARMLQVIVDYALLPERFERYTAEDQTRIQERMKVIAAENVK
jgi:hypothetical protein